MQSLQQKFGRPTFGVQRQRAQPFRTVAMASSRPVLRPVHERDLGIPAVVVVDESWDFAAPLLDEPVLEVETRATVTVAVEPMPVASTSAAAPTFEYQDPVTTLYAFDPENPANMIKVPARGAYMPNVMRELVVQDAVEGLQQQHMQQLEEQRLALRSSFTQQMQQQVQAMMVEMTAQLEGRVAGVLEMYKGIVREHEQEKALLQRQLEEQAEVIALLEQRLGAAPKKPSAGKRNQIVTFGGL